MRGDRAKLNRRMCQFTCLSLIKYAEHIYLGGLASQLDSALCIAGGGSVRWINRGVRGNLEL